ncbi:MAG: helix-turn-helix transcriptional regulator, partial [Alphaproteobacteria bacterium]|nr:helix-turn-helix transcriptional regulator [Alphaproteobacteria bacterium]
ELQLSQREYECLKNLLIGKTMKETAQELKLSPRTIESYLNNIKIKINAHTKSEIIEYFKNDFLNFIH